VTTLITVSNSEGVVGRCDARCHEAKFPECDCCCGGINHACGFDQAQRNTAEMFDIDLAAFEGIKLNPQIELNL
jgi:hypothetical protein